jgi:hypothetical protein
MWSLACFRDEAIFRRAFYSGYTAPIKRGSIVTNGDKTRFDLEAAMQNKLFTVVAIIIGLAVVLPLFAHHGGASFDVGKTVILKGTVKEWLYSNPHCLLTLEVRGDDGKTTQWIAETQSPTVMYPAGYRKNSFKSGDNVTVKIEPVKSGEHAGRVMAVLTADGVLLGELNSTAKTGVTELK